MVEAGTYALVLFLKESCRLQVGKLGRLGFLPGYYVYTGSALGGLAGRLKRHLRPEKRLHWHIDYLLQAASVKEVWYTCSQERLECAWNGIVSGLPGAEPALKGFGSSDCRCYSHLTFFACKPSFSLFKGKREDAVLLHPYELREIN